MPLPEKQHDFWVETADELIDRISLLQSGALATAAVGHQNNSIAELIQKRFPKFPVQSFSYPEKALGHLTDSQNQADTVGDNSFDLPFESDSMDLVISNLLVSFLPLPTFAKECFRVLRDGGVLLTSAFGPDSFKELESASRELSSIEFRASFGDMHNFGDLLLATGFTNPVVDTDRGMYSYTDIDTLYSQITDAGLASLLFTNSEKLNKSKTLAELLGHYSNVEEKTRNLLLTIEVFYGIAWKKSDRPRFCYRAISGELVESSCRRLGTKIQFFVKTTI